MATAYLGLGTNLGDKEREIKTAVELLAERAGEVLALSRLFKNPPWGFESDNEFVNAVTAIETTLPPLELLNITQQIERDMGRALKTSGPYCDRIIDVDILLYDDIILLTSRLTIPHPLMHERRFVIVPLAGIAPTLYHPVLKKTVGEIALSL
jgi:2-amino-4-hydroxy-6-hydroxymethyldihydropteridine diphosphokinase